MSITENERIIEQNGEQICPICRHKFEWAYVFDLNHGTAMEMELGVKPSTERSEPSKHISFIAVSENKVKFSIACPKCGCIHQTEPMSMKKTIEASDAVDYL